MAAAQVKKRNSWLARLPGQHKMLVAIVPLLCLFLLNSLFTLDGLYQQEQTRHWAEHTYKVMLTADQAQQANQASVLAVRGYVLTQAPAELAALANGHHQFVRSLANMRALTGDNPVQQARIDRLQALVDQWESEVDRNLLAPLRDQQRLDPVNSVAQRSRIRDSYLARRTVSAPDLAAAVQQISDTEQSLLAQRNGTLERLLRALRIVNVLAAFAGLLFGLYVIRVTNRLVTYPLQQITALMKRVGAGDTSVVVTRLGRPDEIGDLARALQVFKDIVADTRDKGWLKSQLSAVSQHLQEASSHREFGQFLTAQLAPLLGAGAAIYYIHDPHTQRLDLLGSYGYRQSWNPETMYVPGEGLVGQCVIDRRPIELEQVPERYLRIHSASGEALPGAVSIFPVLYREQVIGVLELAGFHALTPLQRALLGELLPLIALTQENLTRAINTRGLLERTEEQAAELRRSEEILRQQQQVLRDSNAALHAKTLELEEQSQRLTVSEEELRLQAEELQASNEELRDKTDSLNRQRLVLEDLQLDTEQKADELARASQYKSDFLANMSHELRTPLNSLLILSRSLADNDTHNLDDEQIESARIIHDAGSNLLRLINDILDLSKIEAGKMELVIDELPLAAFERTLRRTFSHVAQDKQLDFKVVIDAEMPAVLRTDGARLEQVANNLIGNAFKFTVSGGVYVHVGRPGTELAVPAALVGQPLIAIAVTDTGIGIPADKFQRVFHAFEQVDAGTSRQYGGTGLGLAICRSIAALLGGDIVLHSEPGQGSTFTVLLPETPPAGAEAVPHASASSGDPAAARASVTGPARAAMPGLLPEPVEDDRARLRPGDTTILVIEDDPAFARILADMIHRKNYRVLSAMDGESGLALARQYQPTGILLDVMLPGMDGWTVIERLKSDEATRHLPVHFISAIDEAGRGRDLGAVGFLTKPVSREAIGTAFERLLHFAEGHARQLLIVDDDADSRAAVRTMLRGDGVVIEEAGSAEDALQKTTQTRYDCIVLDLGLPGMSGMELLERLAQGVGGVPPVVIYSGRDLSREENLKLRQYTDSIVVKGARSPERLLDEVSLFLHSIQHAPRRTSEKAPIGDQLKGRAILLVDDDMRNLFALSKVLRGWGLNVAMAQDGHKALKTLDDNPVTELVLMDIMMPGMDGYETMRAIRAQPRFAALPIIALTAKAMRGDREICLEAGASDYLSKPIDVDKLASMIRVWLPR
jgi:CheY-like chemotaxis protein